MKYKTTINTTYDEYNEYIENKFKSIHSPWQIVDKDETIHKDYRIRNYFIMNGFNRGYYVFNLCVLENVDNIEVVIYFVNADLFDNKKLFNKMKTKFIDEYNK